MARKQGFTPKKMEKWISQGRGQGEGEEYLSWLNTWDVPSLGRVNRVKGNTVPRTYHLMSDGEQRYFTIADWAENVFDIREQFPLLPLEETQEIASQCDITHPKDPNTKVDIVLTTDFVLKLFRDGKQLVIARTVKPAEKLVSHRVIEKFEIERRYWEARSIDWGIVTEHEMSSVLAENLAFIKNSFTIEGVARELSLKGNALVDIVDAFVSRLEGLIVPRQFCYAFDKQHGLELGSSLVILKHLIATKQVAFDLATKKIDLDAVVDIRLNEQRGDTLANVAGN